jgi:hypothetical protein
VKERAATSTASVSFTKRGYCPAQARTTIGVALVLLVTSVGLRWTSGVPDNLPDVLANAGGP